MQLLDSVPPLVLTPTTDIEGYDDGIYMGIDIFSGNRIYWSPCQSLSPHILVVGPTGSGKTITLLSLAQRIRDKYGCSTIVFDVKNEYEQLLKLFGYQNTVPLNPLEEPLPLCFCNSTASEKSKMVMNAVATISKVFSLTASLGRSLYNVLLDVCARCVDIMDLFSQRFEAYDSNLDYILDLITRIFNVYPEPHSTYLKSASSAGISVVNLRPLFLREKAESATVILYLINMLLKSLDISATSSPRVVLILDELWHAIPHIAEDLVNVLSRYGRSLGLYLVMATQNVDDMAPYTNSIINNCGGLIAMASPSLGYWQRLRPYLNLSERALKHALAMNSQGEAVARLSPYSTSLFLYIDPLNEG